MKKLIVLLISVLSIILMNISLYAAPDLPEGATDDPGEKGVAFNDVTVGNHTIAKLINGSLYHFGITVSKDGNWEYISRWVSTYPVDTLWIKGIGGDTGAYIDYQINENNYYGEGNIEYTFAYEVPIEAVDIKNVILWFAEIETKIPPSTSDTLTTESNMFLLFALSALLLIIYVKVLIIKRKP